MPMLEMEIFKQDLNAVRGMIDEAGESLKIDLLREQLTEYQEDMGSAGFWDDTDRARRSPPRRIPRRTGSSTTRA